MARGSRILTLTAAVTCLVAPAHAEFFQKTSGPNGGAVLDLVRQPDGDLFAAMQNGPIYRSQDEGWSWTALERAATGLAVLPNGDLYALGAVVARSRDDGASWTVLSAPPARALISLPSGRLVAGADDGVYLSDNDGISWRPSALTNRSVTKLVLGADGKPYAAAGLDFMISDDAGVQWRALATFQNPITALAPRRSGGWWIGTRWVPFPGAPQGGLFRYIDHGPAEWVPTVLVTPAVIFTHPDGRVFVADGGYCEAAWATLYESASSDLSGDLRVALGSGVTAIVAGKGAELFVATGGGCGRGTVPGVGIGWMEGPGHEFRSRSRGLSHAIAATVVAAPGIVYAQGDYSLCWSTDHGLSWNSNGTFETGLYHLSIAAHPAGDVFTTSRWVSAATKAHIGAQSPGNPFFARTRDRGATWTHLNQDPRPGMDNAFAVTAHGTVLVLGPGYSDLSRSTDHGDSWLPASSVLPTIDHLEPGPITRIFATAADGTYLSEDEGATWTHIGTQVRSYLGSVAVARDEKSVYVDTGPRIVRSVETNPGTWLEQQIPALASPIAAMAVDFEGTVYASQESGVSRLRAGATSWEQIATFTALDFAFDDSGYLYCGTYGQGVLRSRVPLRSPTDALSPSFEIVSWQPGASPFRDGTAFSLELGRSRRVSLLVFDARGRVVSTLWENSTLPAGRSGVMWRPEPQVPSGTYFYRLTAGSAVRAGRVTLIR